MDILSFAMQMELDGKQFFEENARKLTDRYAADILSFLAQEEQNHYDFIKRFKEGSRDLPESKLVQDVKNIFVSMKEKGETFTADRSTMMDVLNRGLEIEDAASRFYQERADRSQSDDDRDIFLLLKKQEDKHYSLLSSLIEYYDRPSQWLEQAEFVRTDDY